MAKVEGATGRNNLRRKVVSMRNKGNSWVAIAQALEISPATARRLFDEKQGEGAHFGLLEGKGGRSRQADAG